MEDKKTPEELKNLWNELGSLLASMEKDLDKNLNKKNAAAGRRVRAKLRDLKKKSSELIRNLNNAGKV